MTEASLLKKKIEKRQVYQTFLQSTSQKQWRGIRTKRRAGVTTPLFSIYSKKSIGIGELPDLKMLIDWCKSTGLTIIQLLPMNDVGFSFRPYDAQSGFALEPMYLSLRDLSDVRARSFKSEIDSLANAFQPAGGRVNYKVKAAKLELLWKIYLKTKSRIRRKLKRFFEQNRWWLRDYALFKVLKGETNESSWEAWADDFKGRNPQALEHVEQDHAEEIQFCVWLQWQLFEQFRDVKRYGRRKGVFLMGDLPFLSSRDSADVWAHPEYFKLDLSSGAPPDNYFFKGQRWGTPPCDWDRMALNGYDYLCERLRYAEHFYDLLRVDHVVGLFRLWSIPLSEPIENGGLYGFFDPSDESVWEEHGRRFLSFAVQNTKALITGEDLGTVPECSFRVLEEFGIPGVDVQRWMRDAENDYGFKKPEEYRKNSIATLSTHDMASFAAWWEYEAGAVYEPLFQRKCESRGISFEEIKPKLFDLERSFHDRLRWKEEISAVTHLIRMLNRREEELGDLIDLYRYSYDEKAKFWNFVGLPGTFQEKCSEELLKAALEKTAQAASIFSIQLLTDWLALGHVFTGDPWEIRINVPGTTGDQNWSLTLPIPLEEMKTLPINKKIREINQRAGRI